jgi:hypothetical protein
MFTIFEEENEPLTERAKVDELLAKVQNSSLSAAVAQLRYQLNTTELRLPLLLTILTLKFRRPPITTYPEKLMRPTQLLAGEAAEEADGAAAVGTKDEERVAGAADAEDVVVRTRLHTTQQRNGGNCHSKSVIRSEKSATEKEKSVELSAMFQK